MKLLSMAARVYIAWFENHEELSHEETFLHGFLFFLTVAQTQEFDREEILLLSPLCSLEKANKNSMRGEET
ncbi:hypothetical protein [Sporomusa sphaeroides]|uniref:hypothetical protein n=1 Tax=Sporomusa sphaeroides TaxID=47679 RepID=UPI000D69C76F|nr:hypothetical protein [Sporomusa sphaeroides]